jgi:hypothetical protein
LAKEYQLKHLQLSTDKNNNIIKESLKAIVETSGVELNFEDKLKPLIADKVYAILQDEELELRLDSPMYNNINLDGSSASIEDIFDNGSTLKIAIKSDTKIDKNILDILKVYDIDLPILQQDSTANTEVYISTNLSTNETLVEAMCEIKDSNIEFFGTTIYTKNLSLEVSNSDIFVHNIDFRYDDMLDSNLKGTIDLENKRFLGDLFVNNLDIKDVVSLHDIPTPIDVKFRDNISVELPKLFTTINKIENLYNIKINNITPLYKSSKLLQNNKIKSAKIDINTEDFVDYKIRANIDNMDSIIAKDGKPISQIELNIEHNQKQTEIYTDNRDINIIIQNNLTDIKSEGYDLALNLDEQNSSSDINLMMTDGVVSIEDFIFKFGLLKSKIRENKTQLSIHHKESTVKALIDNNNIKVDARRLDDEYINSIFNTNNFIGGSFNFKLDGKKDNLSGSLNIKDSVVTEFLFLNNLVSFINSLPMLTMNPIVMVPSLLTSSFSSEGYKIKWAEMFFDIRDNKMMINNINVYGNSTDIKGNGIIDFDTKQIDMTLSVSILKNFTSVLGNIPLVGYILLGKEGNINIAISVKGDIHHPKFETVNAVGNILQAPLGIIQRTLTLPFRAFEE